MLIGFSSVSPRHTDMPKPCMLKPCMPKPWRFANKLLSFDLRFVRMPSRLLLPVGHIQGPESVTNWPQLEILTTEFDKPSLLVGKRHARIRCSGPRRIAPWT